MTIHIHSCYIHFDYGCMFDVGSKCVKHLGVKQNPVDVCKFYSLNQTKQRKHLPNSHHRDHIANMEKSRRTSFLVKIFTKFEL